MSTNSARVCWRAVIVLVLAWSVTNCGSSNSDSPEPESWWRQQFRYFSGYSHLDRAYRLSDADDLAGARIEFEAYLEVQPDDLEARLSYLALLHRSRDFEEAIRQSDRLLLADPGHTKVRLYRALSLQALGRQSEAYDEYLRITKQAEVSPEDRNYALRSLVDLGLALQRPDDTLAALGQLGPEESGFDTEFRRGRALEGLGRAEEAEDAYRKALDSPSLMDEEQLKAQRALYELLLEAGELDKAREALLEAVRLAPRDADLKRALGQLETKRRDYKAAAGWFREAATLSSSPDDWESLATALAAMGDYSNATRVRQDLADNAPSPEAKFENLVRLGHTYSRWGRHQSAAATFAEALNSKRDASTLAALSSSLEALGRFSDARKYLAEALKLRPDTNTRLRLSILSAQLGEFAEAVLWLERIPQQQLQALPDLRARVELQRGLALQALGREREALQSLQIAADSQPSPSIYVLLAESHRRLNHVEEAAEAYLRAHQLQPSPETAFQLGLLYAGLNRLQAAEEFLREALGWPLPRERSVMAWAQLGFVLEASGKNTSAIDAFEKALELDGSDSRLLAVLGEAHLRAGSLERARDYLERSLALDDNLSVRLTLAQVEAKLGSMERAEQIQREYLARLPSSSPERRLILENMASAQFEQQRYSEAADSYLSASKSGQNWDWQLLARAAESLFLAGRSEEASDTYSALLGDSRFPQDQAGPLWEKYGYVLTQLNRDEPAAAAFLDAAAAGRDSWDLRFNLGLTLLRLEKWREARTQLEMALAQKRTAPGLFYLGQCFIRLGQPGLAIDAMAEALEQADQLDGPQLKSLYDNLGYLYAEQFQDEAAIEMWAKSLALSKDSVIQLKLAKIEIRQDKAGAGRQQLDSIESVGLTAELQAELLDLRADLASNEASIAERIEALQEANRLAPSPERHYKLGVSYRQIGQPERAVAELERAVEQDPQNTRYREALGYAYRQADQRSAATAELEAVAQADPDYLSVPEDLGYLHMQQSHNRQAVDWFKQAIDNQPLVPVHTEEDEEAIENKTYRMRQEVAKLTDHYDVTAYMSYRTNSVGQPSAAVPLLGGGVPSQGGLELSVRPPGIGFRDERIFEVFGRILWNLFPDSLRFNDESYQGGLGVRYKPFKSQGLFFSGEKLFRIGDSSTDNWLLRALYSWQRGAELRPREFRKNYTLFYADAAHLARHPRSWSFYGEARQGVNFRATENLNITPHLVLDGRYLDRPEANSNYLEPGVGLSFRYKFNQDQYTAPSASFELLIQYKATRFFRQPPPFRNNTVGGLSITGVFHF